MPDLTSPAKYGPRQQRDAIKDAEMLRLWATDLEAEVRLNDTRLIEQRLTAMAATVERLRALTARASA